MRGLDAWITGHYGADHPDNQLCPDCGNDADHHCIECGSCGAEGVCWDCAHTCQYCGAEEVADIRVLEWTDERGSHTDRLCPDCWDEYFNDGERG